MFRDPKSMITLTLTDDDDDNYDFLVHREAVYNHCPFIKAAVQTSGSACYHLSNTTPGAVRFLLQWLYSQKITVRQLIGELEVDNEGDTGETEMEEEDSALIELWALAQKLQLPCLQNLALKAIDDIYRKCGCISEDYVSSVYSITTADCKLRDYYVALTVEDRLGGPGSDAMDCWSKEIFSDLLSYTYKSLDGKKKKLRVEDYYCDLGDL